MITSTPIEDAIRATSTDKAPWYVIPSDHKWFRNLVVSQIIADTMADLDLAFPAPSVNLVEVRRKYHAAVKASEGERKSKKVTRRLERGHDRPSTKRWRSWIHFWTSRSNQVGCAGSPEGGSLSWMRVRWPS